MNSVSNQFAPRSENPSSKVRSLWKPRTFKAVCAALPKHITLDGEPDSNGDVMGLCSAADHDDTNPSCSYNDDKGVFNCFSCSAKGNIVGLVVAARPEGVTDPDSAEKWLTKHRFQHPYDWSLAEYIYDYVDEDGKLLYQAGRWNKPAKHFRQRVPDGKGGYKTGKGALDGVRRVPFKLPQLVNAVRAQEIIYVVEGEKDALNLHAQGLMATTNAQGAGWPWTLEWADYFKGAGKVIVIADNDEPGRKAATQRANIIARTCSETYVINALPGVDEKGDVSDWLSIPGNDVAGLEQVIAEHAQRAEPYEPQYSLEDVEALVHNLTDKGAGEWMAAVRRQKLRWVPDLKEWRRYRKGVWSLQVNKQHEIEEALNLMEAAARDYGSEEFSRYVERTSSTSSGNAMMEKAQSKLGLFAEYFDKDSDELFNVDWKTLNLRNVGKPQTEDTPPEDCLAYHRRPEDYLTVVSRAVTYDPEADCPHFKEWLLNCFRGDGRTEAEAEELRDYLQQIMGECLEAKSGLRRFYFLLGPSGTGKSTFIRTMDLLMGDYSKALDFKTFKDGKKLGDGDSPNPTLANLRGKRFVSVAETSDAPLDSASIKQLTGGDKVAARGLNKDPNPFTSGATLVMIGNNLPYMRPGDAIWERLRPIPFTHQIGTANEDSNFEPKYLHPELPGILNFALEGLRKLKAADWKLVEPACVAALREEQRGEQDPFRHFAEDCLAFDNKNAVTPFSEIWAKYVDWCTKTKTYQQKEQALGRWLTATGAEKDKDGHGKRLWRGVGLRGNPVDYPSPPEPPF